MFLCIFSERCLDIQTLQLFLSVQRIHYRVIVKFLDGPTCRPSSPVELNSKFQEKCPGEAAVLCSFEAKVRAS